MTDQQLTAVAEAMHGWLGSKLQAISAPFGGALWIAWTDLPSTVQALEKEKIRVTWSLIDSVRDK